MPTDNLVSLKDDMIALIEGHGVLRFHGFVPDDVPSVAWEDEEQLDGWKSFVEMAKAVGASFVTMSDVTLEKDDLDILLEQMREQNFPDDENVELQEAHYLAAYIGKTGFIQLGFAHQGVMFVHESSTDWYDRYQALVEALEEFGDIVIEDHEDDDRP